ncbi:hypothetical protein WMW72_07505 [Paenibacillus filicis]|uniref:Uncharacterized protein n=1 Tax=Paenibacillus filicis TaxID=669464 RepID=A0ABU9DFW2_9BACL
MRWIKKIIILALLLAVGAAALLWLVRPKEQLDLAYRPLRLQDQVKEMLLNRKFEAVLSEAEIDSLIKKRLSSQPQIRPEVRITGARFTMQDNGLQADVNLLLDERWPVGARLFFTSAWEAPYLVIRHTGTEVRGLTLPADWFKLPPIRIAPDDYIPGPLGVKGLTFEGKQLMLQLKLR